MPGSTGEGKINLSYWHIGKNWSGMRESDPPPQVSQTWMHPLHLPQMAHRTGIGPACSGVTSHLRHQTHPDAIISAPGPGVSKHGIDRN